MRRARRLLPARLEDVLARVERRLRVLETTSRLASASMTSPVVAWPARTAAEETTTSSSFVDLFVARPYVLGPAVVCEVLARAGDGTTAGEVRLVDDTAGVLAGPLTLAAGASSYLVLGPAVMPGDHGDTRTLRVQARRTAGTSTVGARVSSFYSLQS